MSEERLAISVLDLDRLPPDFRIRLLAGKLDLSRVLRINADRFRNGESIPSVEFSCDLLSAATICDIIRSQDRAAGDFPTRIYKKVNAEGSWIRVPFYAVFTIIGKDGKISLNPEVFDVQVPQAPYVPPPVFKIAKRGK